MTRLSILAACLAGLATAVLAAPDSPAPVVAVLGSDIGPYREALAGLREDMGQDVPAIVLSRDEGGIPPGTRVVVAFGSKAALQSYPKGVKLIYSLAPGTVVAGRTAASILMIPEEHALINALKRVDPKLNTLAVLWSSPSFRIQSQELEDYSRPLGVTAQSVGLEQASDLPDELRKRYNTMDAIWLMPDPALVNATNLALLVEFSRQNKVPLFVATEGLIEEGATASVGPTFREIGRLAGKLARQSLKGEPLADHYHAAELHTVVSKAAAARTGLILPPGTLGEADKVLP